jgi:glycosyltransferase involved in cell wall biosynthesis
VRVRIVDPPAYTPPYDHALCAALARAGLDVELVTSRFSHGPVPAAEGYRVNELFYRRADRLGRRLGRAAKIAGHVPAMVRLRRLPAADLTHFQWLTLPGPDSFLLPYGPLVWTVHDPPPAGGLALAGWRRVAARVDALVTHSGSGARTVVDRLRVDAGRVHVIPHGAFEHLARVEDERPLPGELAAVEGPVVLCFGLVRPYKGIDVLLDAFGEIGDAELWVVGRPMMPLDGLREQARRCPAPVRFVDRFVTDPEIAAFFRRADLVVLPYREADQSGVLYTALAFGKPVVATKVGGFPDLAEHGAIRLVAPGDAPELRSAIAELLADPAERERLAAAARAAAAGPYSWDEAARRTARMYRAVLDADG